jgi:hypothetical protein
MGSRSLLPGDGGGRQGVRPVGPVRTKVPVASPGHLQKGLVARPDRRAPSVYGDRRSFFLVSSEGLDVTEGVATHVARDRCSLRAGWDVGHRSSYQVDNLGFALDRAGVGA